MVPPLCTLFSIRIPAVTYPFIAFGTPRKLPKPSKLPGRVVVLDIAFAAGMGGASFEGVTKPFIDGLGERLAMWVDHHDHVLHETYSADSRFILRTKAQHGACPEMVTAERVERAGPIDTICCHGDFDGLCSAAKWIRGGEEPYAGADDDARAVDTRLGFPSARGAVIDRALRAKAGDAALAGLVVRFLSEGAEDDALFREIESISEALLPREQAARRYAENYAVNADVAFVGLPDGHDRYDKTMLLMLGQERARISVVADTGTVTVAARFDSGVNLLEVFGLDGGMPTVVSMSVKKLPEVLSKLGYR